MPSRQHRRLAAKAEVFAALGDETRLRLLKKLGGGQHRSISDLTEGTKLTRQAVTKHLRVLERARIVHPTRTGRQSLFAIDPKPIQEAAAYLDSVSKQWDAALERLKAFVENQDQ